MKEKDIIKICFIITLIGILSYIIFYENEFQETTITNLLSKEGNKGIIYGKVTAVISLNPTIFIIQNEISAKAFSPKEIDILVGDKIKIYAETQIYKGEKELFVSRVEK